MAQLLDIISNTGKTAKEILNEFTQSQIQDWPLAAANFKGLEKVQE